LLVLDTEAHENPINVYKLFYIAVFPLLLFDGAKGLLDKVVGCVKRQNKLKKMNSTLLEVLFYSPNSFILKGTLYHCYK
jgi:hypothetical protein